MNPSGGSTPDPSRLSDSALATRQGVTPDVLNTGPIGLVNALDADAASEQALIDAEERSTHEQLLANQKAKSRSRVLKFVILGILLLLGLVLVAIRLKTENSNLSSSQTDASQRFPVTSIPLADISSNSSSLSVQNSQTLSINGQLNVNNSIVLTPTTQPSGAITGELYYDQTTNQLSYYNGSSFVSLLGGNQQIVSSFDGATGNLNTSSGLAVSGNTLSNSGVLTLQGENGNVTLSGGPGITVNGTTLSNSGLLSLGGQSGNILLGPGLSMSGNTLNVQSGVQSLSAATNNVTVSSLGNGNWSIGVSVSGGSGSGTVASSGGTVGQLAYFAGVQDVENSLVSQSGSTVTVDGNLDVTGGLTLGAPLTVANGGTGATTAAGARSNLGAAASGANSDITSLSGLTTALTVSQGGTGVGVMPTNSVLIGNGTSPITGAVASTAGECLMSAAGAPTFQTCPGNGGVSSINTLTGALTITGTSAGSVASAGSTITINDASSAVKGLASFNSSDLTVTNGDVDTVQGIAPTSTPTFGQLTLTSSQATSSMLTINNTNTGATGNLLNVQLNGSNRLSVAPSGNLITTGTINGQTIGSSTSLTGSLAVAGTLSVNTISPTGALAVGVGTQTFTLQGNASSAISATNGTDTTTVGFQSPTANVTYSFATAAAGSYNVCTTTGNCVGLGGSVTTPGGTTNAIAKFTGSNSLGNSGITDNGSTVTIGETLSVNTITPTAALTVGTTAQNLSLQGASVSLAETSGATTNSLVFATPSGANNTITLPDATGTVAVSASGPITLSANGNLSCPTCLTSGGGGGSAGVSSVNSATGALTLQGTAASSITTNGTTITINDASSTVKGLASFNTTDLTVTGGNVDTVQGIAVTATPTFAGLNLSTALTVANGGTGATTAAGARSNLGAAASGANSDITSLSGLTTALSVLQGGTGAASLTANGVLVGNGTSPVTSVTGSNGQCLMVVSGTPAFGACPGSGVTAVNSLDGLTGVLTINNSTGAGSTVTINNAKADGTTEGIATFNSTNFTDNGVGVVNTVQNINTGASPTFAGLNLSTALTVANGGTGATTAAGARSNLGAAASGANSDITSLSGLTTALTVSQGGTGLAALTANELLFANSASSISQLANSTLGDCLVSNGPTSAPSFQTCTGAGGVSSLDSLTGSITITNSTGNAGTITINDAAADGTTKGIAAFNSTNFVASSGVINTIQNINTTASPTFANITVSSTINANTITPSSALTIGSTTQPFILQGNTTSTITATGGSSTTTIGFTGTPTGNVTYQFNDGIAAGTYAICTSIGNCAGDGGGITGAGVANRLAVFTGTGSIGSSDITDTSGTNVSIASGVTLTIQGSAKFQNAANSLTAFQVENAGGNSILNIDTTNGEVDINNASANEAMNLSGGFNIQALSTPVITSVTQGGTTGTTTYAYQVVACDDSNCINPGLPSSSHSTATGNATLSATNYNIVTWNAVPGAQGYILYRVTGPDSPAYVLFTTATTVHDTGGGFAGFSPSSANGSGSITTAGNVNVGNNLSVTGAGSIGTNLSVTNTTTTQFLAVNNGNNNGTAPSTAYIQGGLTLDQISAPSAPTVTVKGTAGTTSYTYYVAACVTYCGGFDIGLEQTGVSSGTTITTGNATLSATNYNQISWTAVAGAAGYEIYRTNGGVNYLVTVAGEAATTYNDIGTTVRSGVTLPSTNTTGDVEGYYGLFSNIDTPIAEALNIGNIYATSINLNQNTTIASGKSLTADGTVLFKDSTNSAGAFVIQNASGYNDLLVDTSTDVVTLGNITGTAGAGIAGKLQLADGTSDGYGLIVSTATLTGNQTITLPNASGTVCLTSQNCSTAGSGYILNQSATPGTAQTGNFNISGTGIAGTAFITPYLDTTTAGTLSIGTTNAATIQVGATGGTATQTINIGTNATTGSSTAVTIGSTVGPNSTTLIQGGTNLGVDIETNGGFLDVGTNSTSQFVDIGTGSATGFVSIGDGSDAGVTVDSGGDIQLQDSSAIFGTVVQSDNSTNSYSAFTVENYVGKSVLNVDTADNLIDIGAVSSSSSSSIGESILFADGTTDNFGTTISNTTLSANQTITLPNASGTVCLTSQNCSTAGSGYILNQSATPGTAQTGNFNISGTGIAGTELQTATIDTATSASTLVIGSSNASKVQIGTNSDNTSIDLNSGTSTINLSEDAAASNTTNIATAANSGITKTVNIGNISTGTSKVTIGANSSATAASSVVIQGTGITDTLTGSSDTVASITNSAAAFAVQNAANNSALSVSTNTTVLNENMVSTAPIGTFVRGASWSSGNDVILDNGGPGDDGEVNYTLTNIGTDFNAQFSFWSKSGGGDGTWFYAFDTAVPSSFHYGTANGGYDFAYYDTNSTVDIYYNGALLSSATVTSFTNSAWHTAQIIKNGTTLTMYLDGSSVLSYTDTARALTGTNFGLGGCSCSVAGEHLAKNFTLSTDEVDLQSPAIETNTIDTASPLGTLNIGGPNASTIQVGGENPSAAITIGSTTQSGTITVGSSTVSNTISIGSGSITSGNIQTITIGTAGSGTGVTDAYLGSTVSGSTTGIYGSSVGDVLSGGADNIQSYANSTNAFQVQNSSGFGILNVDTTDQRVGIDTGTNAPQVALDVNGGIQQSGLASSNTSSTSGGDWTELGSCTLISEYDECLTVLNIVGGYTGTQGNNTQATVSVRVKQQALMGSAPLINLTVNNTLEVLSASDFETVTTVNTCSNSPTCTSGTTTVQLWAKIPVNYEQLDYTPVLNDYNYQNLPSWSWTPSSGFLTALPAGTDTSAVYGDNYANTLDVETLNGNSSTAFEVQNSGGGALFTADTSNGYITIGTGTTGESSPALLVLDSGTSSSDPTNVNGAMYYNSSMRSFRCGQNGHWVSCNGLVYSNTAASSELASFTAETNFSKNYSIPANDCQPGVTYLIDATGWYDSASTAPTFTFYLNLNGTTDTLAQTGAIGSQANVTGQAGWELRGYFICDTTGTSGTVEVQGEATVSTNSNSGLPGYGTTSNTGLMSDTSAQTINTTTSNTLDIGVSCNTSSASNNIELRQLIIQRLGPS